MAPRPRARRPPQREDVDDADELPAIVGDEPVRLIGEFVTAFTRLGEHERRLGVQHAAKIGDRIAFPID